MTAPTSHLVARLRALHQLLEPETLNQGLIDRALSGLGAGSHLLVALAYAKRGFLRSARRHVRLALEASPGDARVQLVSGFVSFVTHDYQQSLDSLRRAAELQPSSAARLLSYAEERAGRLGWDADELECLEDAIRRETSAARAHTHAARLHARRMNWGPALRHVDAALELLPGAPALLMERARLLTELGDYGAAMDSVSAAISAFGSEYAFQMEAGYLSRRAGRFDRALHHFERAQEIDGGKLAPRVARAEVAAWLGDSQRAEREAHGCLALEPECPAALRVLGALHCLRGDTEQAESYFRRAIAGDPLDSEARTWLAELHLRRGEYDEADRELLKAVGDAEDYSFPVALVRVIFSLQQSDKRQVSLSGFQEILHVVSAIDPAAAEVLRGGERPQCLEVVRGLLARLGANRSTCTTYTLGDQVAALPPVSGLRFRCRHALQRLRVAGPEVVAAELTALATAEPGLALALCHLGELELWMGEYAQGKRTLEATLAVQPRTRWAYIGLTVAEALLGDPERGLARSAEGIRVMDSVGPAVYVHRGDALRLAGQYEAAVQDLEHALQLHPRRISARICLALSLSELGQQAQVALHFSQLCVDAPGLVSDAARELELEVWGDPGEELPHADRVRVLEHALHMLRGNRSASSITYLTREGRIRGCEFGLAGRSPHAGDAEALEKARMLLEFGMGWSVPSNDSARPRRERGHSGGQSGARPGGIEERPPAVLDAAEIEAFLRDGFVKVSGCFDEAFASSVRNKVEQRVRERPERWVKRYDPRDPARSLAGFSVADPQTWTWPVIHVDGEQSFELSKCFPKAWGAICDLLGPPGRLRSRHITDYMILNLCAGRESGYRPLQADSSEWHIDDPSAVANLDAIRNGLVLVVLFDQVRPGSGATGLLPGSATHVARWLAAGDSSRDLTHPEVRRELASRASRIHEATGQVGDVYLLHPLLLHAAAPNPSGRPRWMANPTLYLHEPLRVRRSPRGGSSPADGQASPVERLISAALESA